MIWILSKPMSFAIRANGFFADLAFKRILQNVVAYATDQLWEEGGHVTFVVNEVFFIYIPARHILCVTAR